MDTEELKRRLSVVAGYRASRQKATAWAQANDVPLRSLAAWCANARRWQARLDGVSMNAQAKTSGFIAAQIPQALPNATLPSAVRIEFDAGTAHVQLHWPLSHTRELSVWLCEMSNSRSAA